MRAALLDHYGPPSHLMVREVPDPALQRPSDVLVAVRTAAVNPIDVKIRAGKQRGAIRLNLPWILGLDVAGEVLEVGPEVTRFRPGDAVMGCPDWRRPGSYAERVVVDEANLVHKPPSLPWDQAAGLPLVGLTAWQCLMPRLARRPGQRVLIQAGSGGVGHVAIQIA
jgi:NADPH:quinone reductase-like Zn-dependent oxidoreductase